MYEIRLSFLSSSLENLDFSPLIMMKLNQLFFALKSLRFLLMVGTIDLSSNIKRMAQSSEFSSLSFFKVSISFKMTLLLCGVIFTCTTPTNLPLHLMDTSGSQLLISLPLIIRGVLNRIRMPCAILSLSLMNHIRFSVFNSPPSGPLKLPPSVWQSVLKTRNSEKPVNPLELPRNLFRSLKNLKYISAISLHFILSIFALSSVSIESRKWCSLFFCLPYYVIHLFTLQSNSSVFYICLL